MYVRHLLPALLIFMGICAMGQTPSANRFEKFAARQDSLFTAAYKQKDTNLYQKLLAEFLTEYNQLSDSAKKPFSGYYMNAYYNLCCTYSLNGDHAMALAYLEKSIKAGYCDYSHMQEDKDLDNIRNDKEFKILVEPTRQIGDYLYVLKKSGTYNTTENRQIPGFTYQPADNKNLAALRKGFNLDSVAGTGNEVSKIINLLHWVHYLIPHDGNHGNPAVKNAVSMIAECRRDHRGLNCRGLATVLNECYLSMGIKSRFVTCFPKDSLGVDQDCHVINMVYCDAMKKWLWIDPTNDAYVMSERGDLLSIEEVRNRIISGQPLIVNPDANWNRRSSVTKEEYLFHYMAKNLYKLECSVNSEYDTETTFKGKVVQYVALIPADNYKQTPLTEKSEGKNGMKWITYKTNNPDLFWQAP
ncbi:MAG: transglutaminase domain-containing protein [Bacteroidetes bacterium]|nr:transglutaminase domain-containing protein [Bacteroidota bacterium]